MDYDNFDHDEFLANLEPEPHWTFSNDDPPVGLPPDLEQPDMVVGLDASNQRSWHTRQPSVEILDEVNDRIAPYADTVVVAICDTGENPHEILPKPLAMESFIPGQSPFDGNSHGTHVGGTAAGQDRRYTRLVGFRHVVAKVLSNGGSGSSTGIERGIRWATDWKGSNGERVDVINLSLGGGGRHEGTIDACNGAAARGVVVGAAAGNSGNRGMGYPAKDPSISGIAARREDGSVASFSSRGKVLIADAGSQILSASHRSRSALTYMSGTCVEEGSYVYGPDGPCKIEDVIPGDTVFAYANGRRVERVVTHAWNRGTNNVMRIAAAGRDVTVTETHEMLCVDRKQRDIEWVRAKDIDPDRHCLVVPKSLGHRVNPYLDTVVGKDFAYLLGYLLGDGWITSMKDRARRVNVAEDEKSHVMEKIVELYYRLTGKALTLAKNGRWLYDDSTRMAMILEAAGLQGSAHEKTLPAWVWHVSEQKQDAILRGYFDADSHRRPVDGQFSLETVSEDLVRRIACLADYRGWKRGRVTSRHRKNLAPNSVRPAWRPTFGLHVTMDQQIAGGFSRLFTGVKSGSRRLNERIRDMGLEPSEFAVSKPVICDDKRTVNVYDLTVPGADNFFTHGLVTHNSMATPAWCNLMGGVIALRRASGLPRWRDNQPVFDLMKKYGLDMGRPGYDQDSGYGYPDIERLLTDMAHVGPRIFSKL